MEKEDIEERPPFFKEWKGMYVMVLANLALTILIFYFLTQYFK